MAKVRYIQPGVYYFGIAMRTFVIAGCLLGCGNGLPTPIYDSGIPDVVKEEPPPPSCTTRQFGMPKPLTELNTMRDDIIGSLMPNELTLFGAQGAMADYDIFSATRPTKSGMFGGGITIPVNGPTIETFPAVTADGLTMYGVTDEFGAVGGTRIFSSRRASVMADFGQPTLLSSLADPNAMESYTNVAPDGSVLYFARISGGSAKLYQAACDGSLCVNIQPLTELNASAYQISPVISADGLTIYFAAAAGPPNTEIFVATRASTSSTFSSRSALTNLVSPAADLPRWISPDGCTLYISSARNNADGNLDMYVATR